MDYSQDKLRVGGNQAGEATKRFDISTNLTGKIRDVSCGCEELEVSRKSQIVDSASVLPGWYIPVAIAEVTIENRILAVFSRSAQKAQRKVQNGNSRADCQDSLLAKRHLGNTLIPAYLSS